MVNSSDAQGLLGAILGDRNTLVFVALIAVVFLIGLLGVGSRRSVRLAAFARLTPTVLTTLGILGTFYGIFIGLLHFDVENIDRSVPPLLHGMKFAFVTSLFGMSSMLLFKLVQAVGIRRDDTPKDVSARDILIALRESAKLNSEGFEKLHRGLVGDAEGSMATQLIKIRSSISDGFTTSHQTNRTGFEEMRADFQSFAAKVADNNSKALIEALRQVIADFNVKISEQFGDNFKHLNQAVAALLNWQENYRTQLQELVAQFSIVLNGVEAARTALQQISEEAQSIPKSMNALGQIMSVAERQLADLQSHLAAFAELKTKAIEALPAIEGRLDSIVESMRLGASVVTEGAKEALSGIENASNAQAQVTERLKTGLEAHQRSLNSLEGGFVQLKDAASAAVEEMRVGVKSTMESAARALVHSVEDNQRRTQIALQAAGDQLKAAVVESGKLYAGAAQEQAESWRRGIAQFDRTFERSLQKSGEALEKRLQELDEQMQTEVTRVLNLMGSKLGAIANKLASDYGPLTEKLRRVVELAQAV